MNVQQYIDILNMRFQTGISREHAYRGDLQQLLESMLEGVLVTNEPARIDCGAPDYILTRKDIPVGYIEAKDIGIDLKSKSLKEQFERYKASLTNLVFTDYLDFHFYRDGQLTTTVKIAEIKDGKIVALPDNFETFVQLIKDFARVVTQSIKSPTKLAEMMAGKAKLLAGVIEKALDSDEETQENSQLKDQFIGFQQVLVHDITHKAFADMYAQTIAYGMFAARYHDPTLHDFSRQEAANLIPHSNPFLRKLFQSIAGYDLDTRIIWLVDDLVQIFLATDVAKIMRSFGRSTKQEDPVIHFYETFLANYDASLRKARGVWYTPEPVVNFIVRAVDDILKTEFGLPMGLADTSKTKIKVKVKSKATADRRSAVKDEIIEQEVHKVQILDPATGTGTFLAEVIRHIHKRFENQAGIWPKYVENDLLPRLNGFELLMTSYAMAHLQLDILLTETGFTNPNKKRFKVFLTNSLEEAVDSEFNLFSQWLSQEANEANAIKREAPVMVVIGNPPYSGISSNNGEWIGKLVDDYKYVDGEYFGERKHWLNDDYVKFIRYGQHFIEKNGSGILAFINPHGFLDNPTFRGMRWNLLKTFDVIYTIDLHGNSKKKETAADGSVDQNVFDIQQGVSINIFVKTEKAQQVEAKVYHFDLPGKRELKYDFLLNESLRSISWETVLPTKPYYFLNPQHFSGIEDYQKGFAINDLFKQNSAGFVSANDSLNISFSKGEQLEKVADLLSLSELSWRVKYKRQKDARDWTYNTAKADAGKSNIDQNYVQVCYRPFDFRWTLYSGNSRGLYSSPQQKIMSHLLSRNNIGIICPKQVPEMEESGAYVTRFIAGHKSCSAYNINDIFPLYIYPKDTKQLTLGNDSVRTPNFNSEVITQIELKLGLQLTPEKATHFGNFAPIDLVDYIYSILHSRSYRKKNKEFLKISFPRIPYPKDAERFWKLVKLGGEIRQLHLLESPLLGKMITGYPADGDNKVTKPRYQDGNVYINDTQHFSNVPPIAWEFYIGGYQPCQKWLKDRKDRELSYEDILHYQKIVVALVETDRLMKEIDLVGVE
ncbi:MAG: N-6 DNA methylase [Bacteroidia bacterium]|nr:N-6 DNA methylase [Bacteroidia bacterium]